MYRDNEDGQGADIKFKFSWIFSDNSRGEGLGTPHLSHLSPSNQWVSLLNFFTKIISTTEFLKIRVKLLGLQFKQDSVFSESKL